MKSKSIPPRCSTMHLDSPNSRFWIDFHWFSMDSYGHSTIFNGFLWIFDDVQWISVDFRLILSGLQRIFDWVPTDFNGFSNEFRRIFQWTFNGFSKTFNDFQRFSTDFKLKHSPWISTCFQGFRMNYTYVSPMLWLHVTTLVDAANVAGNVNLKCY